MDGHRSDYPHSAPTMALNWRLAREWHLSIGSFRVSPCRGGLLTG